MDARVGARRRREEAFSPGASLIRVEVGDRVRRGAIEDRGLIVPLLDVEVEIRWIARRVKIGRPAGLAGPRFARCPGEEVADGEGVGEEGEEPDGWPQRT